MVRSLLRGTNIDSAGAIFVDCLDDIIVEMALFIDSILFRRRVLLNPVACTDASTLDDGVVAVE